VFQGAAGESQHNLFSPCCGYGESVAVDSHGLAQVAFWSNATGRRGYLYGKLTAVGALAGGLRTLSTGETVERADRVALAADASGNTCVAFANGYPSASAFVVETLRGGATAHKLTLAAGHFSGNEPLMALDVDASGGCGRCGRRADRSGPHVHAAMGRISAPPSTLRCRVRATTSRLRPRPTAR
jgi:hypothetical protein